MVQLILFHIDDMLYLGIIYFQKWYITLNLPESHSSPGDQSHIYVPIFQTMRLRVDKL